MDNKRPAKGYPPGHQGIGAALWFLLAWVVVTMMAHAVFYKINKTGFTADAEAAAA
jgi:hypothetical protein